MRLKNWWPGWRICLATFLVGASTAAAFAPLSILPLAFFSLGWLFYLWRKTASPVQAGVLGLIWGMGCFLTGISWVYISLHDVGGMNLFVAATMTFMLCLAVSVLYPMLCGALFVWLKRESAWRNILLFAGLWTLFEWLRGHLFTGFPWLMIGYTQTPQSPLSGYAPVLGAYGIAFLVALVAALLAVCLVQRSLRTRLHYLLPLIALLASGALLRQVEWTKPQGAPLAVSLLQGNIEQTIKWNPEHLFDSMDTYARLARDYPAALTVFPETTIPLMLDRIPKDYLRSLTQNGPILLGAAVRQIRADGGENAYNAAAAITPDMQARYYFKSHLVPFGEFIPRGFSWFFDWIQIPLSDFTHGPQQQENIAILGQQVAVNICYEDVFGEEIIHALPQATLLINISNTAWFGDSLAQPQHLQMAQMRVMETGRMMLRATNSGMTVAINPDGNIAARLPAFTRGGLTVMAQGYAGTTPFIFYGNAAALLLAGLALLPTLLERWAHKMKPASAPDRSDV